MDGDAASSEGLGGGAFQVALFIAWKVLEVKGREAATRNPLTVQLEPGSCNGAKLRVGQRNIARNHPFHHPDAPLPMMEAPGIKGRRGWLEGTDPRLIGGG